MNQITEFKNRTRLLLKNLPAMRAGVLLSCLAALVLVLPGPARAETPPAAIPFPEIGARATADYHGDALGISATSDGARLRCGFQKHEGHATAEGLWLESTGPGAAGKLRLVATTLCREGNATVNSQPATTLPATGAVSVEGKLVRFTRPGVTEEYSVSVDGVRQDFVIAAPPAGAGDLRVELALSGARAEAAGYGAKLKLEGSGRELAYSRLRVEDATGRELTARLEVLSANLLAVSVADATATYPVHIDPTFSDADWVSLGSGIGGVVANPFICALAVSGTNLYVGGYFTTAGGVPATNIAKWDGSTWSAFGSRMNSTVKALAVSGTNLYAGGYFTVAGGVAANCIAKWDGSTWSALGSGIGAVASPYISALAVSGTNLYVGGYFTTAGGVPANCIAKWDGSAWSALGSGMNNIVYALAMSGTNLYAGGGFTTAGGVPANAIAKWDGSAWSALGSGMFNNVEVYTLAVSGTNLYAGGGFTTAGGVTVYYIAKWNGSAWSALGSGMNNIVYALAMSGTNLYAGGLFTTANYYSANYIAKWDGSAWSALGSGIGGGSPCVYALAADGVEHLFVGGFFTLAGTNVCTRIAQANLGNAPTILMPPQSQTAEIGSTVDFTPDVAGDPAVTCLWFFNGTNLISCGINSYLELTNVQFSESGSYTVVVTNVFGAVTSSPVMLNVIAPVARRPVPAVKVMGEAESLLNVDYANSLSPPPNWTAVGLVSLTSTSQYCFDVTVPMPLPLQRFYRAWQTGTPSVVPSLNPPGIVTAITLTGNVGDSLQLDYINQFGPTNAWVTLDTITLTNTSQLYFDVSAIGQPPRLYQIVPVP